VNETIEQNIIHFINRYNLVQKGDKLLIAFSGGADSLFALHFFNKFKSKYGIELFAFHINHSLRGKESDEDEMFCKLFSDKMGIQFNSVKVNVKEFAKNKKESIEEAARNLRYEKLHEYAKTISATKIVTAHNLNDNTETILLNLFRGSGLSGASGIPIQRQNIIRPLLSTSKEDIVAYLNRNKIQYRVDSSNLENDFTRNFLRNEIIPKIKEKINPAIDINLLRFSEIVTESNIVINNLAEDISEKYITITESGIEISNLIKNDRADEFFNISVRKAIEKYFNIKPTFSDISKLKSFFNLQVGSRIDLSEKITAIRERNFVLLISKNECEEIEVLYNINLNEQIEINEYLFSVEEVEKSEIQFSEDKNIEFINGDKLKFPLTIRKWRIGDKFQPIGLKGTKKISDFLTEAKVDSIDKKNQLVLLNEDTIIWVFNYRLNESVKITSETKRILKLLVRPI
jgi:tRNA(Ile)-lysidine synthase